MIVVLTMKEVTVRKYHPCGWCGEAIEKGDLVKYRSFVSDDRIQSEWSHPECWKAMMTKNWSDWTENDFETLAPGSFYRGSHEECV